MSMYGTIQSFRPWSTLCLSPKTGVALLAIAAFAPLPVQAANSDFSAYCQQMPTAIAQKDKLRQDAAKGNQDAAKKYKAILSQNGDRLRKCRSQTWPQNQAIWIRLYPCDARPGVLDSVLDRIVDRGYNQVYVESFYSGKVLLPVNQNPTPWTSVLAGSGFDNTDLLAQVIRKGHDRGLKVYSWMFGLNFGASYVRRFDRQQTIAKNGLGQTSLTASTIAGLSTDLGQTNPDEAFIDPYSPQIRQDYTALVNAIAQRKPDGVLFDYIRYPRGYGSASVASKVQDLWVYGQSSQQSLLQRALNTKGMAFTHRFLSQGFLRANDVQEISALYAKDKVPAWQGIDGARLAGLPPTQQASALQSELWRLSVAHAAQGVVDFVNHATGMVRTQGISSGVVFFPEANALVGQGYDSRLQLWDRFPTNAQWHPMAYGICGNTGCIMQQIQRVLEKAPPGTDVQPVLAGIWQQSVGNRPSLEAQMQVLQRMAPQITSVSHFAFSWQEPGSDRNRKACVMRD
jgi:Glycosyl hydrolase-like 10